MTTDFSTGSDIAPEQKCLQGFTSPPPLPTSATCRRADCSLLRSQLSQVELWITSHWSAPCPHLQAGQGLQNSTCLCEVSTHFNQTREQNRTVFAAQKEATLWAIIQRTGGTSSPYLFPNYPYIVRARACNFHSDISITPLERSQHSLQHPYLPTRLY